MLRGGTTAKCMHTDRPYAQIKTYIMPVITAVRLRNRNKVVTDIHAQSGERARARGAQIMENHPLRIIAEAANTLVMLCTGLPLLLTFRL